MKGLGQSFKCAFNGIRVCLSGRNMRIHLCIAFYVVIAGFTARISLAEWAAVLLSCGLVVSLECINTAIERLCDALHPGRSEAIGRVKDISAGAALVSAVAAAAVGGVVFFRPERVRFALTAAAENPVLAAVVILCLPLWLYFIFGRKNT